MIGTACASEGVETPVLNTSRALGEVDDRVRACGPGGDDYLPKPYAFAELLDARRGSRRRRSGKGEGDRSTASATSNSRRLSHSVRRRQRRRLTCSRASFACSNT